MMVMIMGCVGLSINVIFVLMLGDQHHGHGQKHDHVPEEPKEDSHRQHHSWSIQSVLLHIACDAMNNMALILASTLIWKLPDSKRSEKSNSTRYVDPKNYADPACTVFIATVIMILSVRLIHDTGKALVGLAGAD